MTATARSGLFVITRPVGQAASIATALSGLGHRALIAPMLEIVPLPAALPPLDRYAALAFTSANAVAVFAGLRADRHLPAYAVGAQTAAALRRAGFADIRVAAGDAAQLAALIAATSPGPVLHVSGRAVARELAEMLAPVGIPVERVAIYDAVPASVLPEMLTAALYARTVDGVLFFSARTAETFGTLMMTSGLDSLSGGIAALCLSEAVGRTARILKWSVVAVAERPDSRSMLALLPAIMQASTHG